MRDQNIIAAEEVWKKGNKPVKMKNFTFQDHTTGNSMLRLNPVASLVPFFSLKGRRDASGPLLQGCVVPRR